MKVKLLVNSRGWFWKRWHLSIGMIQVGPYADAEAAYRAAGGYQALMTQGAR